MIHSASRSSSKYATQPITALAILADYALARETGELSAETLISVRRCVLDCVASSIAGANSDGAKAARIMAQTAFGDGPCSLWFSDKKLPAAAAIMANCTAASILDLDDGHRAASGHPGSAIIPSCLVVAEEVGASWNELAAAIVVGYEIAVRIAAGRNTALIETAATGKWCSFGVAAAIGRLRGLSADTLTHAMAIAGVHSPVQPSVNLPNSRVMNSNVKEGIPWAALTGALAVDLAQAGFTGPLDFLDKQPLYDAPAIVDDLTRPCLINGTYFKPYSCCRWAHAAIDGLLDILDGNKLQPGEIIKIDVHTFSWALRLSNDTDPLTLEDAQYSIPFCLGLAASQGPDALLPLTVEQLHDPHAVALAGKVHLTSTVEFDTSFPKNAAARIVVHTKSEFFSRTVTQPLGDPENPMSQGQLMDKFKHVTKGFPVSEILNGLIQFESGQYTFLVNALANYRSE